LFNVASLNARSIGNKSASINTCIVERHLDIFAIVETWHDGSNSPDIIASTPSGYKSVDKSRSRSEISDVSMRRNHGGICVIMRSDLKCSEIQLPHYKSMECLALSIRSPLFCLALLVVYRPGSAPVTNLFFDEFADALERCSSHRNLIVVGDVNIHLDCTSLSSTTDFTSLLDGFGLSDNVHQPTHLHQHQLDVFITRPDEPVPLVSVDPPIFSDHSLILATYKFQHNNNQAARPRISCRKWRSLNIDNFTSDLLASRLLCDPPVDVSDYFNCYDTTLTELLNVHAPVVMVKRYARPVSPWFDTECHLAKVKTRKLEKKYRSHKTPANESSWRSQFRLQRQMFQNKFRDYWNFTIETNAGNSKMLWSKLRCLLEQPTHDSATDHSANDFAMFFAEKTEKIRQSTNSASDPVIDRRDVPAFLSDFRPVTSAEVLSLIHNLPPKQCCLDPVPTWLLKRICTFIAPVIAAMCSASITQQFMPACHKKAIVHPLLKKPTLDQSDLSSFRPISNLSFVSKILERLINNRLTEFMDKYSLLPKTQSAYREHHSTETALVRVHNDIVTAIDQGDVCALVLLDLSAAFDTVDHSILLDVLQTRFGLVDNTLTWIRSYLSDRSQQVCISQDQSPIFPMPYGVPQGSVLGPKQFIAYTEDIVGIFDRLHVTHHGYADDTQGLAHSSPSDTKHIVSVLEQMVFDVGSWCASRRLQLNASKTELIWFGMPSSLTKLDPNNIKLHAGNVVIEPSDVVRDLGVYFDSKLSMRQHISRVTKICFFQLRRLRPIRRHLGRQVAQRLVSAFVLSRLDYCNALFAELPASTLAPLQRCQNAAARLVLNLRTSDHITPALIELHWLPVKHRIIYKICLLVYKSLSNLAPTYLRELFVPLSAISSRSALRSSTSSDLSIPATILRFGDRAFAVAGARHWNQLPADLRAIGDITNFKKKLKTYLFIQAFDLL